MEEIEFPFSDECGLVWLSPTQIVVLFDSNISRMNN